MRKVEVVHFTDSVKRSIFCRCILTVFINLRIQGVWGEERKLIIFFLCHIYGTADVLFSVVEAQLCHQPISSLQSIKFSVFCCVGGTTFVNML